MTSSITQLTGFAHLTDLPCWQLRCGDATVVVSSYGAHVLQYICAETRQQTPQLWLSPKAVWQGQQPIRGGVPICWPWFGKINPLLLESLSTDARSALTLPNHGLVRTRQWQKTAEHLNKDVVSIEFSIEVTDIPWHPHPVTLRYLVQLSQQLTLTLSCDQPIAQQAALHSYFTVADSQQTTVSPLPANFYDKVSDSQDQSDTDVLQFQGEIDRVYPDTAASLILTEHHRSLAILQQGHDASVLWNPAADKAAASADIPADSWSTFVCVESARLTTAAAPLQLTQIIKPPREWRLG